MVKNRVIFQYRISDFLARDFNVFTLVSAMLLPFSTFSSSMVGDHFFLPFLLPF